LAIRAKKADLESVVGDWTILTNQLIKPLRGDHAVSIGIDIRAVTIARLTPSPA
jgi:hypothetical protein